MLLAARALGLGATLTTLYLAFETEVEAALGLPADMHSYAILPIGYPMVVRAGSPRSPGRHRLQNGGVSPTRSRLIGLTAGSQKQAHQETPGVMIGHGKEVD